VTRYHWRIWLLCNGQLVMEWTSHSAEHAAAWGRAFQKHADRLGPPHLVTITRVRVRPEIPRALTSDGDLPICSRGL
jgi:hypothetical protein